MNEKLLIRFSNICTWKEFIEGIPNIQKELKSPLFRGQGNGFSYRNLDSSSWGLLPSLYRRNTSHPEFIQWLKNNVMGNSQCRVYIEKIINSQINTNNLEHIESVVELLQHLGFATPILDWTKNPLKAAFFAFNGNLQNKGKVTIFLFDQEAWINNPNEITARDLKFIKLKTIEPLIFRQKAQESVATYCNGDVYSELLADEHEGKEDFISWCSLPATDKDVALECLKKMGITEESLFPDKSNQDLLELRGLINLLGDINSNRF